MNIDDLIVNTTSKIYFIKHDDISYCKSDNCYTTIHLTNGEVVVICKSLTKLEGDLDIHKFLRVSQSYLVNISYIRAIDKKKKVIELQCSTNIPFTISLKDFITNSNHI